MEHLKSKNGLMCLDWTNQAGSLQGSESGAAWRVLDVMVVPCNVKLTGYGAEDDRIPEDCNQDKQTAIDWLQSYNMVTYYN